MTEKQINKIRQVAVDFREGLIGHGSPAGKCFMVSGALQGFLEFSGIKTQMVEGEVGHWNHFWLRFPDGTILDPTADQFGLEPVFIGEKPEKYMEVKKW